MDVSEPSNEWRGEIFDDFTRPRIGRSTRRLIDQGTAIPDAPAGGRRSARSSLRRLPGNGVGRVHRARGRSRADGGSIRWLAAGEFAGRPEWIEGNAEDRGWRPFGRAPFDRAQVLRQ